MSPWLLGPRAGPGWPWSASRAVVTTGSPGVRRWAGFGPDPAPRRRRLGPPARRRGRHDHPGPRRRRPSGSAGRVLDDPTRWAVASVVALVALAVQVYSTWYLETDDRYPRFAATVSLFSAAMLLVVVSGDLVSRVVGWEVMGWCSYLLIGHCRAGTSARRAAHKAFLVTRVADLGFVLGVIGCAAGGTGLAQVIDAWARPTECIDTQTAAGLTVGRPSPPAAPDGTLRAVLLTLVVIGVLGKSAQLPFQDWLADAMEGPTPASALIHAATMVAAGTVVLAALFPLLSVSQTPRWVLGIAVSLTMLMSGPLLAFAPERPQTPARLVDGQPGRRHALGARGRPAGGRARRRAVPPVVARHLQGVALPRHRLGRARRRRHRREGASRAVLLATPLLRVSFLLRPALAGRCAARWSVACPRSTSSRCSWEGAVEFWAGSHRARRPDPHRLPSPRPTAPVRSCCLTGARATRPRTASARCTPAGAGCARRTGRAERPSVA